MRLGSHAIKRFSTVGLLVALPTSAGAYELTTHQQLSWAAFDKSGLSRILQSSFGIFPEDTFRGRLPIFIWQERTPRDWVGKGARDEDSLTRPFNHFFDPYHNAALNLSGAVRAPDWALEDQEEFTSPRQDYSYKDAREAFYRGLTARDSTTHQSELGHTFYSLGHIIHLIQDMGQPQHTRSDPHPNFIPWRTSFMEKYIERLAPGLAALYDLDAVTVPAVTRARDLWVRGTGAGMTGRGMSEFSNMNFVSAGTNFTEWRTGAIGADFPTPLLNVDDVSPEAPTCNDGAQAPGPLTFYFNDFPDPDLNVLRRNERMTTYSIFDQHLIARGHRPIFALNCFNLDTAADILLPRAVGYSAALLKYFFRGQLEIAPPDRYVYALAVFQPDNTGAFSKLRLRVRNATPDETAGPGRLTAVVRYRTPINAGVSLIDMPLAEISGPRFAVSEAVDPFTPTETFQEVSFDFTSSPIPTNAADLFLTVVFKGTLGAEDDAVMVGGKDLYEPDPLDRLNVTDYNCFGGQIYYVADLPPYNYPDHVERDVNGDQIVDLKGPLRERTLFIKTFDLTDGAPTPSAEDFDFTVPETNGGQYVRFMLLQDQAWYGIALRDLQTQDLSTGRVWSAGAEFQVNGVLNEVIRGPAGEVIRRYQLPFLNRGLWSLHQIRLENSDPIPCLPALRSVPVGLTRVDGTPPAQ